DRKQLEQEQARLTAVLEATPDFIGITDVQGEILWHNKPLRELRQELSDFDDHRSLENCHPDWVNKIIRDEALPTAMQQGSWSGELALLDGDGNEIPVSQVIIAHQSASGEVENFSTVMRDIRVIKHTEAALKLSEARAQATFTQAAVGFVEVSLKTKKCVRVNNWFCDMLGYSRAELTEMIVSEITHPDDIPASIDAMKQLHQGEVDSFTIEKRYIRKDRTLFWAETTCYMIKHQGGEDMYSVALIQDISDKRRLEAERQQATLELQLSEARANAAFEQAAVGIAESNITDGKITRTNNYFCQMTGYTAQELMSLTGADLTHPDDLSDSREQVKQLYTGKIDSFTLEKRYLCKDRSYFWATTAVTLINNPAEDSPRCLAVVQDISDRKHYEQQLQDLSERLELAIESARIGIWEWDCHASHLSWSERMFEIYGLNPEVFEHSYQDWANCLHPEDLAAVEAQKQGHNINGAKRYTQEFRVIRPDGEIRHILATAFIQRDADGQHIRSVGTNLDITDRKTAELALQDAQAQFRYMTENVPGMIFRYVLHPDGSDELTYVSSQVREMFEVEPEDALSDSAHMWDRIHPDDVPRLSEEILVSAETLQPFTSSYRLVLPQKGLKWVQNITHAERLDNGDVVWDGVVIDINDRKQAEMALEKEALRRTVVFNASPDGIHVLDQEGNVLESNEGFAQMLGYSLNEVSQLNVTDWDAQWSEEELQDIFQDIFQNCFAGPQETFETLHRRKDGSVFPVEISACPMEWNGEFSIVCISRDISERKQAESELKRTNQELARATRLKDEFLANMSHELRTPLNAILGMTEGLQDEVFGEISEQQLKSLTTIEQSGLHLLELINEVLDLAKIEAGNIELTYTAVSVTHLCQSSLAFIEQQSLEKGVQLHLKIPWDLPLIKVNERRIRQVLINLLNNAVKFTPAGGNVTLEVERSSPDDAHTQPHLRFDVRDTGIGIDPNELNRLFQPFVQIDSALNRQYEGTGLGLALVKRIVELHGGHVSVTSKIGVGSCFTIELPYGIATQSDTSPPETLTTNISEGANISKRSGGPTLSRNFETHANPAIEPSTEASPLVLLAEDNEANITTLSSYLQAMGYRVQVATSGQAAIEFAQAKRPSIVLMDIQLPDLDGLSAIEQIRQLSHLAQTPIIALTAFATEDDRTRCLAAVADKYLSKPVKLKQLALSIQALISE
ncbi:MAG: PAS domain S-box protein, partial [Cyanobacteria bacterium J06633_2]